MSLNLRRNPFRQANAKLPGPHILFIVLGDSLRADEPDPSPIDEPVVLIVTTDKQSYKEGDTAKLTVFVFNKSDGPLRVPIGGDGAGDSPVCVEIELNSYQFKENGEVGELGCQGEGRGVSHQRFKEIGITEFEKYTFSFKISDPAGIGRFRVAMSVGTTEVDKGTTEVEGFTTVRITQ